jgi:polysaccharide biosynthesis protein PslG
MFVLDFNNPLYNGNKGYMDAIDTPAEIKGYTNFAAAAVKRYQWLNPIWEIYNEPNRPTFWSNPNPAQYAALVKAAVPAMRRVNPNIHVVGPALGHNPKARDDARDKTDYAYLESLFRNGVLSHFDTVTIHPYPDGAPEMAIGVYANVRRMIDRYAPARKKIPLVSGEWGYTSAALYSADPQVHADYWTRMYLVNVMQRLPLSIGFKLEYTTLDPSLDAYELGFPLFKPNGQAKPAYVQLQKMINALKGYSFVRRQVSSKNDYLLDFKGGTKQLTVAWTTGPGSTVRIFGKSYRLSGRPIYVVKS